MTALEEDMTTNAVNLSWISAVEHDCFRDDANLVMTGKSRYEKKGLLGSGTFGKVRCCLDKVRMRHVSSHDTLSAQSYISMTCRLVRTARWQQDGGRQDD